MVEDNYFDTGLELMDKGDFEAAVAMFDSAIKLGLGDLAAIYLCRSEALLSLGRWDEAEDSINSALAIEPYLAVAYNERGNIRRARRDNDLAINDYTMRSISSRIMTRPTSIGPWLMRRGAAMPKPRPT